MNEVSADNFSKEFMKILDEFKDVTEDQVGMGIIETADKAVSELQTAKPSGAEKYGSWNAYLADWTRTNLSKKGADGFKVSIHNKKHYQLAHLLEKGHAIRSGGREVGHARAFPHIAPVAEKAENSLEDNILKHIR